MIGCDLAQIETARAELYALLKSDAATPQAPFEDFETLRPAKDFANRHASILLALDATIAAIVQSKDRKRA